jgi:NADH dehydrogenase
VQSVDVDGQKSQNGRPGIRLRLFDLATGARHSYFGHNDWERLAPGLKSLEDAIELRRRILMAFEYAEKTNDEAARKAAMTFVIIGGGPTVWKWPGQSPKSRVTHLRRIFGISIHPGASHLIEGDPRLLSAFPQDLSQSAQKQLTHLGVDVRTGVLATNLSADGVQLGDEFIPCQCESLGSRQQCVVHWQNTRRVNDRVGRIVVTTTLPFRPP